VLVAEGVLPADDHQGSPGGLHDLALDDLLDGLGSRAGRAAALDPPDDPAEFFEGAVAGGGPGGCR
jgi:hypothetical protein